MGLLYRLFKRTQTGTVQGVEPVSGDKPVARRESTDFNSWRKKAGWRRCWGDQPADLLTPKEEFDIHDTVLNARGVPSRRTLVSDRLKSAESLNYLYFLVTFGGEPRRRNRTCQPSGDALGPLLPCGVILMTGGRRYHGRRRWFRVRRVRPGTLHSIALSN